MDPEIKSLPGFTVVGLPYRGINEKNEIPQLWEQFVPRVDEIKHRIRDHKAYGVIGTADEKTGEFDYLTGLPVESVGDLPDGMRSWEVPEQLYAVFPCTLPSLMHTFQYIYQVWLPQSGYTRADGPEFELYDENFRPDEGRLDMFVYIPIKK